MVSSFNIWHLVIILVGIAAFVLFIAALVSIARAPRASTGEKVIWIVVVLILPLLGSIVWFAVGRRFATAGDPPAPV
ncbi:PLDc N-terminal domain-containing protein [Herbiconiux daphne]|uniref:PLDc N-terminal domain-containing protein n=1 Tax=Herbiconiux daphne TaxID=2970914 RepID=A0ABT2H530_9MICO|nr:PLDc N-terminal domain-containing protein [Herbiconiux daphne]MCS5735045.1 PLDc N-terminal domain-containing protein [Herbiconiux daphne]